MTFLLIPFKVALKGRMNESKSAKKNSDRVNYFFKQLVRITNGLRSIENKVNQWHVTFNSYLLFL